MLLIDANRSFKLQFKEIDSAESAWWCSRTTSVDYEDSKRRRWMGVHAQIWTGAASKWTKEWRAIALIASDGFEMNCRTPRDRLHATSTTTSPTMDVLWNSLR